jgi:hypothetical protein
MQMPSNHRRRYPRQPNAGSTLEQIDSAVAQLAQELRHSGDAGMSPSVAERRAELLAQIADLDRRRRRLLRQARAKPAQICLPF